MTSSSQRPATTVVQPPEIKDSLAGMVRVTSMDVDPASHHYIVLSFLYPWMQRVALPAANGLMLDFGCGGQPYRNMFETRVSKYIGADVAAAANVRLDLEFKPGEPLSMPASSVDTILSTQTLEHVKDVDFYLNECNRLLKPGGTLILTAPMQWRHHEVPFDFLRFTKYGIHHLLSRHRFEVISTDQCGGAFALMGQIFLSHLSERGIQRPWLFKRLNRLFLWLDKKYPDYQDTINWMCIARKAS
jgi:SAM-dependent methyltransferase